MLPAASPVPLTVLVDSPPLALVKITLLVNPPTATGANCTTTLVVPKPATLKVAPDRIVNGPLTLAVPLLTAVPPSW